MRLGVGLSIVFLLLFFSGQAQRAQFGRVKGTVIDSSENQPLEAATISAYRSSDSSLLNYALTGGRGDFIINVIPKNTPCFLVATFNGYQTIVRNFTIPSDKPELDMRLIRMQKVISELGEVTVIAQKPPVVVKQDTIEFNVGSFVTRPNAMIEDVLKQMPGVEVESDGSITINGKKVSKVTLDGKEFFGGDPKIALKNLPKEIIDKIQVTDNRSREARFNKTRTGDEDIAINLTIRKDRNKGLFGMLGAGYGTEERYEGFANANYFKGGRQVNLLINSNNTNRGGQPSQEFNISNGSSSLNGGGEGIVRNHSAGLNFSDNLSPAIKINGNYFFSKANAQYVNRLQRQNILPDTTFYYNANNNMFNESNNHRFGINFNVTPDTLTEIYLNSNFDFSKASNTTFNEAYSNAEDSSLINNSQNRFITNNRGRRLSAEFFFGRRFRKKGRGFTLNANFGYNDQPQNTQNNGTNIFYKEDTIDSREQVDQRSRTENNGYNLSVSASYSEPLFDNLTVYFWDRFERSNNSSDKITNRFNPVTGLYDIEDSVFTNSFRNTTQSHTPGVNLVFQRNKLQWTMGAGMQFLSQDNLSVTDGELLSQDYVNFTPSATLQYSFSRTFNLNMHYNGRSQQPGIQQLQPVPDNRNPLYIRLGNPDLQPAFHHSININARKNSGKTFWYASVNFNTAARQIINETYFDEFGRQVTRPMNVNGNYSLAGNLNYSKSWKGRVLSFRMTIGTRGNYNTNNTFTNKVSNRTNSYSIAPSLNVQLTWRDIFSLQPVFNVRYYTTKYSLASIQDVKYNTKRLGVNMFWNYPRRLIIENSLQYTYNSRTAPGFRKGVAMWSAAVNWQLFSKQQGTVRLAVYDILRQNLGIQREITSTYIEDSQSLVLRRYFLLSFIYNLRRFAR